MAAAPASIASRPSSTLLAAVHATVWRPTRSACDPIQAVTEAATSSRRVSSAISPPRMARLTAVGSIVN